MTSFDFPRFDPFAPQLGERESRALSLYEAYKETLVDDNLAPVTPEARTTRELRAIYDQTPRADLGFISKFGNALAEDTVTGQLVADMFDPQFASTGYVPTEEDIQTYASDMPETVVSRIMESTDSFEQFLYELQEARVTLRRRKEVFGGGVGGIAQGGAALLLAAGGEAVIFTGLMMAATGGVGTAGVAAANAKKASRIKGVMQGLGVAVLADFPLETTRYNRDKTLTTTDLLIALGAAGGIGATLGGLFPGMFSKVRAASETAAARQGLEAAADAGARTKAGRSADLLDPKISIRELAEDDPTAEVMAMSQKELEAEARRVGVALDSDPVTGPRVDVDGPDSDFYKAYGEPEGPPGASNLSPDLEGPQPPGFGVTRTKPVGEDVETLVKGEIPLSNMGGEIAGNTNVPRSKIDLIIDRIAETGKVTAKEVRTRFGLTKAQADEMLDELQKRGLVTPKDPRGRRAVTSAEDRELLRQLQDLPSDAADVTVPSYIRAHVTNTQQASVKFLQSEFKLTKKQAEAVLRKLEDEGVIVRTGKSKRRKVLSQAEQDEAMAKRLTAQTEAEAAGTSASGKSSAEIRREREVQRLLAGEKEAEDKAFLSRVEKDLEEVIDEGEKELARLEKEFAEAAEQNQKKFDELGRDEWIKWVETGEGRKLNNRVEKLADQIDAAEGADGLLALAREELREFRANPSKWLDDQKVLDDIAKRKEVEKGARLKAKIEGRKKVTKQDLESAAKPKPKEERVPSSLRKSADEMTEEEKQALKEWKEEMKRIDDQAKAKIEADEAELAELRAARESRMAQTQRGRDKAALQKDIDDFEVSSRNLYNQIIERTSKKPSDLGDAAETALERKKALRVWQLWRMANNPVRTGRPAGKISPAVKFLGLEDIDVGLTKPGATQKGLPTLPERGTINIGDPDFLAVPAKSNLVEQAVKESKINKLRMGTKKAQARRQRLGKRLEKQRADDLARRNRELGEKQANVVNKMLRDKSLKRKARERLQQEVIEARKKISQQVREDRIMKIKVGIAGQITREFENAPNMAAKRLIAQSYGVSGKALEGSEATLRNATIKAAQKSFEKGGKVTRGTVGKPKIPGFKYKGQVKVDGRKVNLKGNIEKMLWALRHSKNKEAKEQIRAFLKSRGIEDPDALSKEFSEKIQNQVKKNNADYEAQPTVKDIKDRPEVDIDLTEMGLESAKRTRDDGSVVVAKKGENFMGETDEIDIRIDRDLVDDAEELFPNTNVKRADVDNPHEVDDLTDPPLSAETDAVVVSDTGEALAEGPSRFAKLDVDAVSEDVGTRSYFGHGDGLRESGARLVEEFGAPINRVKNTDKVSLLTKLGQQFYKAFTPTVIRMSRSNSPMIRKLGRGLMTHPRARGFHSATAVANANYEIAQTHLKKGLRAAEAAALKEGRELDDALVIHIVRGGTGGGEPEQIAKRAIDDYFKEIFAHAEGAGIFVKGVTAIKNYFPRVWAPAKFRKVIEDLGKGDWDVGQKKLTEFLTDAVLSHAKTKKAKMSRANAQRVAKRIVSYGMNPDAHRDWNSTVSSLRRLRETLVEELEGVQATTGKAEFDADDLMELIIPATEHQAHISFGRQRLGIDELFVREVEGYGTLRFSDLTDNNLDQITRHYGRQVLGAAEGRRLIEAVVGDANKIEGLPSLVARVKEEALRAGDDASEAAFYAKQIEFHFRLLTGQRVYAREIVKYGTMLNMLSMGTMGMALGIAQIPEIANIFLRTSFTAASEQFDIRDVVDIFRMGLRGKTTEANRFSSSVETLTGIGGDLNRRDHFMRRMDDLAIDDDFNRGFIGRALDNGRLFASLNPLGIMPMDTFLRRWAARASFQHFVDTAYKAGPDGKIVLDSNWWSNSKIRFGELGMEADDIERLSRVLRNPEFVEVRQGIFGNYKVHNFDFSKVDDHYIVDKFILALRRHTDNMIQRQTPGELPAWMNAGVAKILTQFRVFTVAAKSKQLAAGIARGDAKEMTNVVGSAFLGMLGYSMITYYRALGQPDPEAYLESRLSTEKLIKSAIMRTGYSTIFPMLTDLLKFHADGEGFFDASMRTTGLGIDPLSGSTAYKNYETAKSVASNLMQSFTGVSNLTQRDVRDAASLIWLTKIPIANQLINQLISQKFPESNR